MSSAPSPDSVPSPPPSNEWEFLSMSSSSLVPPSLDPRHPHDGPANYSTDFVSALAPLDHASPHVDASPDQSSLESLSSVPEGFAVSSPHRSVDGRFPYFHPQKDSETASWWKQSAEFFRLQWCSTAKPSTLWSVALLAAFVGVVAIGYRWQHERCQNQQLRIELLAKDEKLNDLAYQVNRLKEAMTGRRRVGLTRSSFF